MTIFFSPVVGHDASIMSPGQRFMTDLLVSSLMADGGLESALEAAIKNEISEIEGKKVGLSYSLHTPLINQLNSIIRVLICL